MIDRVLSTRLVRTALLALAPVWVATPAIAQQQLRGPVDIAWNRYYDFDEVTEILGRLQAAFPTLITLKSIGRSEQDRPIWLVTINNPETGDEMDKPAMYIDGSVHANEIQATETVLYAIWYLATAYGQVPALTELVDTTVHYFVPVVNPDGRADWFARPHSANTNRTGLRPTDRDGDGLFDEDGPSDLDGDGDIGVMWVRDPHGTHRRDPQDPRRLVRVPAGERGDWTFAGSEGIDDDGDGRINEDPPGGYDMNRNWPGDWQPEWVQGGSGDYPLCYAETRAVGEFILSRPNIAAGQSYHNTGGMILRGPGTSYMRDAYPRADLEVYERIGRAGEEMLPFYRLLVIHADLYNVHGGFVTWLSESLGIISFTNELWTDRRILQTGQNPDEEARWRWRDRVLFGQTFTDWTLIDHPDLGEVLVGGGTRWSSRTPPPFMLEEECHRNFAFTVHHAQQMPRLSLSRTAVRPLDADGANRLWQVTVEIANAGAIPTRTARAADRRIGLPDFLRATVEDGRIVTAGMPRAWHDRTMQTVRHRPERLSVERGIPGSGRAFFRFIVEAAEGATVGFEYASEKATNLRFTVPLVVEDAPR